MWTGSKPPAMRFFRESSLDQLPVSIAGLKLGDRVIMLGCSDPKLIAQLAVKTGLTGRACAVDSDTARTERAAEVAPREGALIETTTASWTSLPFEHDAFDVAIVRDVFGTLDAGTRTGAVAEVVRVLRPGGRCLVMDGGRRGALFGARASAGSYDALATLQAAGFKASRVVAERDGMRFTEGVKENLP